MRPGNWLTRHLRVVGVLAAICAPLVAGCGGADGRPAEYSYVYSAILEPSCATASCHSDFTRRSGVNFGFKDEALFQLCGRRFISPGHPEQSELVYLLQAKGARRMPPDFPLPTVDIQIIYDWIASPEAVALCQPIIQQVDMTP
jgi:hypothetical protein